MEPISFALALGSIPGIFTSCVECFQYIQFGREFEKDFDLALCKLEAAELRLTRWGVSLGIEGPETKLHEGDYNEEDIKKAYHWLDEIKKAFASAIKISHRYESTAKPEKLALLDTDAELYKKNHSVQELHNNIRRISHDRVKPRKRDRVTWALYRKGNFENLIESISELTSNLIELFPSKVDVQRQLCKNEVKDIDIDGLKLLDTAMSKEDDILKSILVVEVQTRPNFFTNIEIMDHFRGHFGDNVGAGEVSRSGIYSHIKGGGHAEAHFGSNIGNFQGESIFDAPRVTD